VAIAQRLCPAVRIVRLDRNAGPGPARDAGYRAAAGDRVAFVDNDVMPTPGCLEALGAALDADPVAAIAMARIVDADAPESVQFDGAGAHCLGLMTLDHAGWPLAAAPTGVREIGSLVTACFMVDRRRWGAEPLCDPSFFFHLEDHELGLRARLLGHRLLAAPAAVCRHGRGTPGVSLRATGRFTATRVHHTIRNRWQIC
jgi:GT2 family glycosyltransferase